MSSALAPHTTAAPGAISGWFPRIDDAVPPVLAIWRIAVSPWLGQAAYAVARLGIADLLAAGPQSSAELAAAAGVDVPTLHRVLRFLASVGLFAQTGDGRFAATPVSACLTRRAPNSLRDLLILTGEEFHRAWGGILASLEAGEPAFRRVFDDDFFGYLDAHPACARTFHGAMAGAIHLRAGTLARHYDFGYARTLVDVGGGSGVVLASILRRYPHLRGVLCDLPAAAAAGAEYLAAAGLADRCEIVAGSFFDAVPAGGDLYLVSQVVHLLDDEEAVALLGRCRAAMPERARLLLVEAVVPEDEGDADVNGLDLHMLVLFGGRERTAREFRALLAGAGYRLGSIIPLPQTGTCVVEATLS
ncbi:MAG TPA: ArsR family transcriptional regulator [Thermomicrobiales bacterium]|nr:ArsR family transcriptional regulator [Thermomicrobiales bacterium]